MILTAQIPYLFFMLLILVVGANNIIYMLNGLFPRLGLDRYFLSRDLDPQFRPFLARYFPFYQALKDRDQVFFERRVQKFIDSKKFIPRGGLGVITPEMKAVIAGSAIQITFGHPAIYFQHFSRILVYPDTYYSTITRQYHQGEVNRGGIIVVSWTNLQKGVEDAQDGRHLGLHEMAHALRLLNVIRNDEHGIYDQKLMNGFDLLARKEMERMHHEKDAYTLFRSYAATCIHEFFAVAVEVYFEKPRLFRQNHPQLYAQLYGLLRVDPLYPGN